MPKKRTKTRANERKDRSSREYRDTVLRMLFKDSKKALELCGAVSGLSYPEGTHIEDCSLRNSLAKRCGDMAFLIERQFFYLHEHMSTPSLNMPLRILQYGIEITFSKFVEQKELLKSSRVKIPTPKFYVLYILTTENIFQKSFSVFRCEQPQVVRKSAFLFRT